MRPLEQSVPWGRSRGEYELMFGLKPQDLTRGVLDCGGGPASFVAALHRSGNRVVSVDPIYGLSGLEIRRRFEEVLPSIMARVGATPEDWVWNYHQNLNTLCAHRRLALEMFLADYEEGLRARRYIAGHLGALPFDSGTFGLAVCSHLLFLYSDLLSEEFHVSAVAELCRVADEVRIFPIISLAGQPSRHLRAVRAATQLLGWMSEIVRVDYEVQRGANEMLRIFRA